MGNRGSFHRAYVEKGKSIPDFMSAGLIDYGAAFGAKLDSPINYRKHKPIADLLSYAFSNEKIHGHFRVSKYSAAGEDYHLTDEQVEFFFIRMFASTVDMCMHKLIDGDFSQNWFKAYFREIERGIFDEKLEVDLIIPIIGLSFDFPHYWLDEQKVGIFKMDLEFQEARHLDQQFHIKVPTYVARFSSHAFMLKGRTIENDGYMQTTYQAQFLIKREISLINSLFGLLKAATGHSTGYAQVIVHPLMWTPEYVAHLPAVISQSVRAYPSYFDDGVWRTKPDIVSSNYLDSISEILTATSIFNSKKMRLAVSRLNSCLLRETEEDQILDACIGLEALFGDEDKQEMTHKLALRIAGVTHLFERGEYLKKDVFKAVKTIYGYRSAVAHGKTSNSKNQVVEVGGQKFPTVQFAIDLLRETIIALGKNSRFLKQGEIDTYILLDSPS